MLTIPLDKLDLKQGQSLLDLGCGTGRHLHKLYYDFDLNVYGVDVGLSDLNIARDWFDKHPDDIERSTARSYHLICTDALCLPFPNHFFDHIIVSEVLEHIPDWTLCLKEIRRVLKPQGSLSVSVPRYWPERICWWLSRDYHRELGGHIRIFPSELIPAKISHYGLNLVEKGYVHGLHSPYWWAQCLFWDKKEKSRIVSGYKKFLEWDILKQPRLTRWLSRVADPLMGKSIYYLFRPDS